MGLSLLQKNQGLQFLVLAFFDTFRMGRLANFRNQFVLHVVRIRLSLLGNHNRFL